MNFKKGNKISISHYTPAKYAKDIMDTDFMGGSVYIGNDDTLRDNTYDIKKLNGQKINKGTLNGGQKVVNLYNEALKDAKEYNLDPSEYDDFIKHRLGEKTYNKAQYLTDPNNRNLITYANADNVMQNYGKDLGNGDWEVNVGTPVRYVADMNIENSRDESNPYNGYKSLNDPETSVHPVNPKMTGQVGPGAWDLGEANVNVGKKSKTSPFINPRLQIPFGAVTQDNSKEYLKYLGNIDPSKFDANDTYTRRVYNLYAKKNGLKQIPDPRNFYSALKTKLANIGKSKMMQNQ